MIKPIAVASRGYLTGVARDIVSIPADGYLTSVVAARRRGPGNAGIYDPFMDAFYGEIHRDDEELIPILAAWLMEVINA
jgi:hypothetical protein